MTFYRTSSKVLKLNSQIVMATPGPMSLVFICFYISLSFGHGFFFGETAIDNAADKGMFLVFFNVAKCLFQVLVLKV